MKDFPNEVTLFSDGVYRWRYDYDLWSNRYMLHLLMKVLGVIFTACAAVFLLMLGPRNITPAVIAVCVMIVTGILALTWIIYYIIARIKRGSYVMRFEMDESGVRLVASGASAVALDALGIIGAAASIGSGGNMPAAGLSMNRGIRVTAFSEVTRVITKPKYDTINLHVLGGMNQIYASGEDYKFVRSYILSRVPEKARLRSDR